MKKIHIRFLTVFSTVFIVAGQYYDFAPLKLGNVWNYRYASTDSLPDVSAGMIVKNETTLVKMDIVNVFERDDTVFHVVRKLFDKTISIDTLSDQIAAIHLTVTLDSLDTLFDHHGIGNRKGDIVAAQRGPPVFYSHGYDSALFSSGICDFSISENDGAYDLKEVCDNRSYGSVIVTVYRTDIGCISDHFTRDSAGIRLRIASKVLTSFSGGTAVIAKMENSRNAEMVLSPASRSRGKLVLPYFYIVRNNRSFDLNGRRVGPVVPETEMLTEGQRAFFR